MPPAAGAASAAHGKHMKQWNLIRLLTALASTARGCRPAFAENHPGLPPGLR